MTGENKAVAVRLPTPLRKGMEKYVERDTHINSSEFIRSAIREKLKREGNGILQKIIDEEE